MTFLSFASFLLKWEYRGQLPCNNQNTMQKEIKNLALRRGFLLHVLLRDGFDFLQTFVANAFALEADEIRCIITEKAGGVILFKYTSMPSVLRSSMGITTLPRVSIFRTMPVDFIPVFLSISHNLRRQAEPPIYYQ
jgi:hypothetical protein